MPSCKLKEPRGSQHYTRAGIVWSDYPHVRKKIRRSVWKSVRDPAYDFERTRIHLKTLREYSAPSFAQLLVSEAFHRHAMPVQHGEKLGPEDIKQNHLKSSYSIRNEEQVLQFLHEHPHLIPLVEDAPKYIYQSFGREELVLEVSSDPEDETTRLVIYIKTNANPIEARSKLNQLDDDWWLDAMERIDTQGKIGINVEFK